MLEIWISNSKLHEWLIDTSAYDLEQHAEGLIDMFLAGLVARPPLKR